MKSKAYDADSIHLQTFDMNINVWEKECLETIWFPVHLFNQIRMQTFLETTANLQYYH